MGKFKIYESVNKWRKLIDKSEIVSFDIFDTLLLRHYVNPADLFLHIEKDLKINGFSAERINAERRCRVKHPEKQDITFDDIYGEIDYKYNHLKKVELEYERRTLHANWQIKPLFEYAKERRKKIIAVSDMYLPADFLEEILSDNGICGVDNIFVSGVENKTKHGGDLFRLILNKFHIEPSKVLHIGDNKRADFKIPSKLGIRCCAYRKMAEQYFAKSRHLKNFYEQSKDSPNASILTGIVGEYLLRNNFGSYWKELGYKCAGPVAYAYSKFIEQVTRENNITNIIFIARDGHLLKKVYNFLYGSIKNSYIYASRIMKNICFLDQVNPKHARMIVEFYEEEHEDIREIVKKLRPRKASDWQNILKDYHDLFLSKGYSKRYLKYLSKFVSKEDSVALVDTITGDFSSQYLLTHTLGMDFIGIYWSNICHCKYPFRFSCFKINSKFGRWDYDIFTYRWDFIEFIISSPELPVKFVNVDGSARYFQKISPEENIRVSVYPEIVDGAMEFVGDISKTFGKYGVDMSAEMIIEYINLFIQFPEANDIKNMSNISFASDPDHGTYLPLLSRNIKFSEYLLSPIKTMRILRECKWHFPSQILFLNIIKPVSIKIRPSYTRIAILPYLPFCRANIRLGKHYEFILTVGNQ